MKYLLAPAAILATVAMLFSAITPAHACICETQTLERRIDLADFIVLAEITGLFDAPVPPEDENPHRANDRDAIVMVERYFKGLGPTQIAVDDSLGGTDCAFLDDASINKRYVLFLRSNNFKTNSCIGNMGLSSDPADEADTSAHLAELEAITGPGQPPDDSCEGACVSVLSWGELVREAFWALALLIPLAVLVIATMSPRRR